ncbi:MAG: glycosyl transferase [Cyanobium sp. ARS6]|nr:glycosyl transferase [Cyanobium sp. ARS6]
MGTVIQIVQHLQPGGIETLVLDLASLTSQKHKVFIISLESDKSRALANWPRLNNFSKQLIFLNKKAGWRLKLFTDLIKLFHNLNPDIVHTHHIGPLIYGGLAARMAGVQCLVHTEHDAWHLDSFKRRILQRLAFKLTNPHLVADAKHVAYALAKRMPRCKPIVIPNGININHFVPGNKVEARHKLNLPLQEKIIGCAARLEPVKGHRYLLSALITLDDDIHLALAGIGQEKESLMKQAQNLNISHRVHFLGHVNNMLSFYQSLDVFCLPSLCEGLPLSPLEAQSCGVPVVVTRTGGSPESTCSTTGLIVEPRQTSELAFALKTMCSTQQHSDPREFVKKHGDVRMMIKAYENIYNT